jgi:ankyrin repeat protein
MKSEMRSSELSSTVPLVEILLAFSLALSAGCGNRPEPSQAPSSAVPGAQDKNTVKLGAAKDRDRTNETHKELLGAAAQGDATRVEALLKEGIDINQANADGETVLMRAAANGHNGLTETLLVTYKADPNLKNMAGKTAEQLAREKGHSATGDVFAKHKK